MIIAIYVDGLLIYNVKKKEINNVKKALKVIFYMSDLEGVSFYLTIVAI